MPLCQRSHNIKMILEIKPTQLRKRWLLPVCFVPFCDCSGSFSICQASAYTASALASYSVGCWSSWKRPILLDTAISSYLVCLFWEGNVFSDNSQDKNQGFILLPLEGWCITCAFSLKSLFRTHYGDNGLIHLDYFLALWGCCKPEPVKMQGMIKSASALILYVLF